MVTGTVGFDAGALLAVGGKDVFKPVTLAERGGGELAALGTDAPDGDAAAADNADAPGGQRRLQDDLPGFGRLPTARLQFEDDRPAGAQRI